MTYQVNKLCVSPMVHVLYHSPPPLGQLLCQPHLQLPLLCLDSFFLSVNMFKTAEGWEILSVRCRHLTHPLALGMGILTILVKVSLLSTQPADIPSLLFG